MRDALWAYAMIAPMMIGLLIFYIWPVFQTFFFSFTQWGAFGKYTLNGLTNYQSMLSDPELGGALRNTLIYTVLSVGGGIVVSLFFATLLNQKIRGVGVYRTLYFLPVVTIPAAIAIIWQWLYNGDYGLINFLLSLVHIHGLSWLTNPATALYAIIMVAIWGAVGNNMVLFLAGLQGISSTYTEAAAIDGAGPINKFFHITLPLLSPTIFFVTVTSLINAFQVFDLIFLMLGQNSPALPSGETVVYLYYEHAFIDNDKGYASAIAVFLFVIILVVTIVQLRLQKRWVHYD
ncbi:sugar ABC transporter permease [Dictyobacter sp. S3.2.2.5]|uniref:Sugar ABC transporter permease n=1 Tax=Dictyobacter halimunensis TaxID=3026934 RepID=A0ABQ6FIP3_9CHLR|nr:sugar ABC transporter permease [Dictyobacter sp. S3.2.2.5]